MLYVVPRLFRMLIGACNLDGMCPVRVFRYNTPTGQGAKIKFTDGVTTTFTRLERPHLVFKTNQMVGDPIYLTNSAQYGNSTNPEGASGNGDACYTLIQPINQL